MNYFRRRRRCRYSRPLRNRRRYCYCCDERRRRNSRKPQAYPRERPAVHRTSDISPASIAAT